MLGNVTEYLQQLYFGHTCHSGCTHDTVNLTDGEIDDILNGFALSLHNGELNSKGIHADLYADTARKLTAAITKGMGGASFSFDDPNNALRANLIANVHAFSGAKSLTENFEFSKLLFDEKGELKPFKQYLNDVKKLHFLYNENYLSAEYGHAVASSQMAILWNQYNDDDWLEYSTAGDLRVRDAHIPLDGIVQQKNSTFWNSYYPPNGWNCRCTVVPADAPKKPMPEQDAKDVAYKKVNEKFMYNPGQQQLIFRGDHPYYSIAKNAYNKSGRFISIDEIKLDALQHYGLKPVQKILKKDNLPAPLHVDTETDFLAWWATNANADGNIVINEKHHVNIFFSKKHFRDYISGRDGRHTYAVNLFDIVENADEVWYNNKSWYYLKYFNDGLYAVICEKKNEQIIGKNMYKLMEKNYKNFRKGILL